MRPKHTSSYSTGDCVNSTFVVAAGGIYLDHTYTFASHPKEPTPLLHAAAVREVEQEDGGHSAQTAGSSGGKSATGRQLPQPPRTSSYTYKTKDHQEKMTHKGPLVYCISEQVT